MMMSAWNWFLCPERLGRAREFYEVRLGLTLVEETPFALVMRNGATTLRIAKVEHLAPQPFTVLGWVVDDIHQAIAGLGVECVHFDGFRQDAAGVWTAPGRGSGRLVQRSGRQNALADPSSGSNARS
jgi:hypothetical protein